MTESDLDLSLYLKFESKVKRKILESYRIPDGLAFDERLFRIKQME